MSIPQISRVRHEAKRRQLTISRLERLAPHMLRIVARGEELSGFTSLGFDDHVKLFFPKDAGTAGDTGTDQAYVMRDFTPRRYDETTRELWIEFYLHQTGPAASWAAQAKVGDPLIVGGPRGSSIIQSEGIDLHVLIGDETAFPAMSRRLEELPPSAKALVIAEAQDTHSYPFPTRAPAGFEIVRTARAAHVGEGILSALRNIEIPKSRSFFWIATESQAARALRRYLVNERGVDKHWVKAAGYWQQGAVGSHDVIHEDL